MARKDLEGWKSNAIQLILDNWSAKYILVWGIEAPDAGRRKSSKQGTKFKYWAGVTEGKPSVCAGILQPDNGEMLTGYLKFLLET